MKLREIFRFELAYQVRRVSTWLYFAVLLFSAFINTAQNFLPDARSGGYFLSAPFVVAQITIIGCLIWLLIAAFVAGDTAARDVETGMHPLTYAAPVSKADYLGGRFLAAFVVNASLLLAVTAGMLIGLYSGAVEAAVRGPFRPAIYLTAYSFVALPIVFVITAIQFSFAALSRRAIVSYLGGVLILVAAFVATTVLAPLLKPEVAQLLDLLGFITVDEGQSRSTPAQLNTQLIGLDGSWLASRLLWIGIALGALAFTYARFRLGHPTGSTWRSRTPRRDDAHSTTAAEAGTLRPTPIPIPQVPRAFGLATRARQTRAIAWTSFASISTSRVGLVLLTVVGLLATLMVFESPENLGGVPLLLRTDYVLKQLTFPEVPPAYLIIPLLIVFWSGELVWRERDARLSEIVDAAPVTEWVLLLGKLLGLGLVLVLCMAVRMLVGVLMQVSAGYFDLEVSRYLQILFGLQLAEYLLLAVLALVLQVVVNQRHVGHLTTLVAFVLVAIGTLIVPDLLAYASGPSWSYTDMRGFGGSVGPWLWFKLYWAAWALLLAVAARLLLTRGREAGLGLRLRMVGRRFTRATAGVTAAAVMLIVMAGGFIFYNTNVLNAYRTAADRMEQRAEYERRYGQYEGIPQPGLTGINLHVEIYPERREVEICGTYCLVNSSPMAIDSIHLAPAPEVVTGEATFDRPVARVALDDERGHRIYSLEKPLQPGDSLELRFEVRLELRGFTNNGIDTSVVANGTYFTNLSWLPAIGYQPNRELSGDADRRAQGLAPRAAIPSLYDTEARRARVDRVVVDAVVGTDEDQTAVAPGALRRTWTEAGRRYFHYVTDTPIENEYAVFSANYAVHEEEWTGAGQSVTIQIFHHPSHTQNLERIVRSAKVSLSYYTKQFGPYPFRHLRFVEHPGRSRGMHAEATTIDYQEGFSLLSPRADRDVDLPYAVVAHEVAHQWWGTQLPYARVEGAGVLSESLATYSSMRLIEETLGPKHLRRYLRFLRLEYDRPRSPAMPPLLRATDSFLSYRKGPLALYALGEYIGKERVNEALRRLLEKHGGGRPPLPTTLDLHRELAAVTPEAFRSLLHDLFEANTFWELETEGATAEQTEAGTWQVTLGVQVRKMVVDEAGVETELPMDDWVEVGVFVADDGGEPYRQKHRIRSGQHTITVTVPHNPARAGLDPNHLLVDWEMDDNVKAVRIPN